MPDSSTPSGASHKPLPPNAHGDEIFGAVLDPRVLRRFVAFLAPYRGVIIASIVAVLVFTLTQIAVPLVIRYVIDTALPTGTTVGTSAAERLLGFAVAGFFAVVAVNFVSNYCQQVWVATTAEHV